MKFRVSLAWKLVLPLSPDALKSPAARTYFNVMGGRTFVRSLGGDFRLNGEPDVLRPTDLFHSALRQHRIALGFSGNRFPYHHQSAFSGEIEAVNVTLHHHADVLCATIRLAPFDVDGDINWHDLRDLRKHKALWSLAKLVLSISSVGVASQDIKQLPQVLPLVHICAVDGELQSRDAVLASLVTGHDGVNSSVAASVFAKNEAHHVDSTVLLVDKQGLVAYTPSGAARDTQRANFDRFEVAASMLQLAAVTRRRLRDGYALSDDLSLAILEPESSITGSVSGLKIWRLVAAEFSLKRLLLKSQASRELIKSTDRASVSIPDQGEGKVRGRVLFFTVTNVETKALRDKVLEVTGASPVNVTIDGFQYKSLGFVGDFEVMHQISGMGSGGIMGSQEAVRRGIHDTDPVAVIMVGIAFGIDPVKQPIGTILVSNQLQQYDLQRVNKDSSITLRGDKVTASPRLLNWVSHTMAEWSTDVAGVEVGLMLSGDKLVDNQDYRDQIVAAAPESIGGEMEGSGLYVASQTSKVDWLLIKSVCDWADGNKSSNKSANQFKAASSAAEFAIRMLQQGSGS